MSTILLQQRVLLLSLIKLEMRGRPVATLLDPTLQERRAQLSSMEPMLLPNRIRRNGFAASKQVRHSLECYQEITMFKEQLCLLLWFKSLFICCFFF
ncbi:RPM1-interacting protein 4-like [Iris pallida]|nr:RPM1-interacting protein 4-like [Iris pallida]